MGLCDWHRGIETMTMPPEATGRKAVLIIVVAMLAVCATAGSLHADGPGMGALSLSGLPGHPGSGTVGGIGGVVSPKTLSIMAVGLVLARLSWNLEDPDRIGRFLDQDLFSVTDVGDTYGDGLFLAAGVLGLSAAGRATRSQRLADFSADLTRSLLISSSATWALKLSVGRRRPNGGPYSFPSGHTALTVSLVGSCAGTVTVSGINCFVGVGVTRSKA